MFKKTFSIIFIIVFLVTLGCGKLGGEIKIGDKVSLIYSAKFEDGTIFKNQELIEIKVGNNETIKGIDDGIIGLKQGDRKIIKINPENGYGKDYDKFKVQKISKIIFDRLSINPEIGKKYKIGNLEGVIKSSEGDGDYKIFMLDTNPRETYENIILDIKILKIN